MAGQTKGLLSDIMQGTPLGGINIMPAIKDNEIRIELTPEQLKQSILSAPGSNLDAKAKDSITIEFHEGKMLVRIKLW